MGVSLQTSEVTAFEEQLIRLETALEFQDKPKAMEETRLMMYTWRTLASETSPSPRNPYPQHLARLCYTLVRSQTWPVHQVDTTGGC